MKLIETIPCGKKKAKVYRNAACDEYVVKFYVDGRHLEKADYFTDFKDDAIMTAKTQLGVPL